MKSRMRVSAIKTIEHVGSTVFLAKPVQAVWERLPILAPSRARSPVSLHDAPRFAVVAHAYYPELLGEIMACWRHVGRGVQSDAVPLHITTVESRAAEVRAQLGALGNDDHVTVHVGPNRGRDIAPFVSLLNAGVLDPYDAVLKVHTKRSPHLDRGDLRRRVLFAILAGAPRQIRQVERLFRDPGVGMVGWHPSFRKKPIWWLDNEARVRLLAHHAIPNMDVACGFFQGSMFWVRPAALAALRSLQLTLDDFEGEAGQLDGTLHHAIERMFTLSAWASGYRVCAVSGLALTPVGGGSGRPVA